MNDVLIFDVQKNEIAKRKLTAEEIENRKKEEQLWLAAKEEQQNKKTQALQKLEKLGLSIEDLKTLGLTS
jgi:hypothetical protein